jgi:acetyltransferase-like isoleucine patch superfamily enzyme
MKKIIVAIVCLLPYKLPNLLLRLFGYKISMKSKIGFSLIFCESFILNDNCKIGHFNFIKCNSLELKSKSYIGHFNILKGPFLVIMEIKGAIGNFNKVVRAKIGVTYGNSILKIGVLSKITSKHYIDLTRSIIIGNYSTLAGINSQIWTHGYIHESTGAGRIRVDGEIIIGNNVYIGSACIFNPGLIIGDAISLGSGSVVSKNLVKKGLYVNQSLRHINHDIENVKAKLEKLGNNKSEDNVYIKNINV